MAQNLQAVRDDLAFIKAMASEGRRAPLLSGRFLLSAGLVYGCTSLLAWAIVVRLINLSEAWLFGLWVGATVVFIPCIVLASRSVKSKPGATSTNNRAVAAVWQGLGCVMLVMLGAVFTIANLVNTPVVFAVFPSLVLSTYGMAWWVTGSMSELRWIRWTALACFAAAVGFGFIVQSPAMYLAYAAALFLLLALPGWLLMRAEPGDIV
ncbi:MAG: hypothetical protein ACYDD1_06385 [Caulobacteraceae bacterium]